MCLLGLTSFSLGTNIEYLAEYKLIWQYKLKRAADLSSPESLELTLAFREESSSTLLGFRSRWSRAGERLWRKFIPRATW